MKTYKITISVDIPKLLDSTDSHDSDVSIEELVKNEFGWLQQSGIFLSDITEGKDS